jgi:DNA-directed RNA polymerase subunit RPC12/RpoP
MYNAHWICFACDANFVEPLYDYVGVPRCPYCDGRSIMFKPNEIVDDFSI